MSTAAPRAVPIDAALAWQLARETATEWVNANPFRLAAALAYYTLFSLAPLLVIAVGIAGLAFGEEAVRGEVFGQLRDLFGDEGALAVQKAVAATAFQSSGFLPAMMSVVTLLVGSSAVFAELQDALNTIWHAQPKPSASVWSRLLRKRLLSFAMVVVIGFLLLVSLALSAILNAVGTYLGGFLAIPAAALELTNFLLSFSVITVLFASIYRVLPDVDIAWSDVSIGAAATSAMFTIGKSLIGAYLGRSVIGSTYGAAGALAVLLVWLYYSALILFLGAVFTRVYERSLGSRSADDERSASAF